MSDAKTAAAERRLVLIRLLLLLVCTLMCPALVERPGAHAKLTYALVALGWAYSLFLFAAMPSRKHAVMRSSALTAIADGAYSMVSIRKDGEVATLVVRDRGIGIDPQEQARIFDRFERTTAARSIAGLGLGLWIARQIVEHFGGTIAVESTPRSGSTITVRLPLGRVTRQDEGA